MQAAKKYLLMHPFRSAMGIISKPTVLAVQT